MPYSQCNLGMSFWAGLTKGPIHQESLHFPLLTSEQIYVVVVLTYFGQMLLSSLATCSQSPKYLILSPSATTHDSTWHNNLTTINSVLLLFLLEHIQLMSLPAIYVFACMVLFGSSTWIIALTFVLFERPWFCLQDRLSTACVNWFCLLHFSALFVWLDDITKLFNNN